MSVVAHGRPSVTETLTRVPAAGVGRARPRLALQPLLLVADLVAVTSAHLVFPLPSLGLGLLVSQAALVIGLFVICGLYRTRLTLSVHADLPVLIAGALGATVLSAAGELGMFAGRILARAVLLLALLLTGRLITNALMRGWRCSARNARPTLVLGAGRVGAQMARLLLEHPECGLRPLGFVDGDPLLSDQELPLPVLGGTANLDRTIDRLGIRAIIVAFVGYPGRELVEVLRTCDGLDCEIFFVPRLFELHPTSRAVDQVWGMPLVRLRRAALRGPGWAVKRLVDLSVAAVGLVLFAPLLALCAVALRWEGGPGVLFRQERVGLDGRTFTLLKLRTLKPENRTESDTRWNVAHDHRLGQVGRLLRGTSIDELPQLVNVLRGEMSLVGPRPERPYFVSQFSSTFPRYPARHRVPCGLTGLAQVHGLRGDTDIGERIRFDNHYIENWSLWLDLSILLRSVAVVLGRRGA